MKILLHWLIYAIAIMLTSYLLPGIAIAGIFSALLLAVVLGAINAFIRPIVIILTLPINILTLGLFTLVINALLIILASTIVPGFGVQSFWWAMGFAIVLSMVNWVLSRFQSMSSMC